MQNAEQLEKAYETLSNSAGSSAKEQEAYMNSLAGKINALKESLTSIAMHTIDSDMFKGFVEGATKGIQAVDNFIQKFGGVGTAVMVAIPMLTTFNKSFSTITKGFTSSIPIIGNWQSSLQKTISTQQQRISVLTQNIEAEKNSTSTSKESIQALGKYQQALSKSKAAMMVAQAGAVALRMAMSLLVSAGIAIVISGLQKLWDYCTYTSEEFEELSQKTSNLKTNLEKINEGEDVAGKYVSLNRELQNANVSAERHSEITKEIEILRDQLGENPAYKIALENENLSLEEQLDLIEKISNIETNKQIKDLKDSLPNAQNLGSISNELDMYTKKIDTLQEKIDTLAKGESVTNAFGKVIKATDTDAVNGLISDLDDTKLKAQETAQEILGIQDSIEFLEKQGVNIPIEMPDSVLDKAKEIIGSVEKIGSNINTTGFENLTLSIEESKINVESLSESLANISTPELNFTDMSADLDLYNVTSELAEVTKNAEEAQTAMEKFMGVFDFLGSEVNTLEKMKEELEESGKLSDDLKTSIISTGDAELISLLNNKDVYSDVVAMLKEKKQLQEETYNKTVEEADKLVEGKSVVESQMKIEKELYQQRLDMQKKYNNLSLTSEGNIVSSDNSEIVKRTKIVKDEINNTKRAVIELNGTLGMVTFDKDGNITDKFRAVKEVAEDTFSIIGEEDGKTVTFEIKTDGTVVKNELSAITEAIDGTQVAITKLNGKEVTVNFNSAGEIVGEIGQVVERFDGLKESIIDINGTKFSMTIDADGEIVNPLKEVQTSIDGTIQKVEEINGKRVVLSLGDDGVFRKDIEATNNLINDFKDNIENLNGKSIEVNIDGTEQLASNLREITQETDGVYNAIATVNGQDIRIRVDEDGNLLELIDELGSVQQAVSDTQYAFESIGDGWTVTNAEGVMTWIWNVHDGLDGLKIGIGEINNTPIRVEFDENGNYKIQELQWNIDGLLETTQMIDGKTVVCTYDLNGNLIEQKEVISEVNNLLDSTNGKEASATANINTSGAEQKAKLVNEELLKIDEKSANATIGVEDNGSLEKIEEVKESVDSINGKESTASVNVDSDQANANLDSTKKNMNETEKTGEKLEKNVVKPKVDISSSMNNLQLLRRTIQQTKTEASRPIIVTVRENGVSNVIGLLRNLLNNISNARRQASSPITITTIRKEVTQYSTTGSPKAISSRRSMPEQASKNLSLASEPSIASSSVIRNLNEKEAPKVFSEPSIESSNDGNAVPTVSNVSAYSNGKTRALSRGTDAISSIGGNINDLNYYYKAIGSCTSALKDYNQALQEVRDISEDHKKWLDLQIDRYFRLNDAIEDYDNLLSYNAELQKSVIEGSSDYYSLQREELYLYQKKIDALKSLQAEQVKEKDEIASLLREKGFIIDSYGNLLNSQELLANEMAKINAFSDNDPNKDFYIENIKTLSDYVDRYTELMNKDISGTREEILALQNTIKDTAMSSLETLRDKLVSALQSQREEEKEKEIGVLDSRIAELKKQLEDLDDDYEDKKTKRAKLEAELSKWEKDDSAYGKAQVKKLREQLNQLNKEIAKDEINKEIENIESEKDKLEEIFDKKLEDKEIYAEADRLLASKNMEEITKLLEGYTDTFKDLGGLLGDEFTTNFKSQIEECFKALEYLKGQSNSFVQTSTSNLRSSVNPFSLGSPDEEQSSTIDNFNKRDISRLALLNQNSSLFSEIQTRAWSEITPKLANLDNIPNMNSNSLRNIVAGDVNSNNKIEINNEFNVTNNTEMDVRKTEKTLEQVIRSDLRRFGKIK